MNDQPITKAAFVVKNAPKILIALIKKHTQITGNIKLDDLVGYEQQATSIAIVMFENIQLQTETETQRLMRLTAAQEKVATKSRKFDHDSHE